MKRQSLINHIIPVLLLLFVIEVSSQVNPGGSSNLKKIDFGTDYSHMRTLDNLLDMLTMNNPRLKILVYTNKFNVS